MRRALLATVIAVGFGLVGLTNTSAGPAIGVVIDNAVGDGLLTFEVDCRRYPHRHRNAKPHGLGFGCTKKAPVLLDSAVDADRHHTSPVVTLYWSQK